MYQQTPVMIPRQTPLCIPHFLQWAQAHATAYSEGKPPLQTAERVKTHNSPCPTRVQPRRSAKINRNYGEGDGVTTNRKRKLDADTDPEWQVSDKKRHCTMADLYKKVSAAVHHLQQVDVRRCEADCVFGFKPWVCASCELETAYQMQKLGQAPLEEGYGRALEAEMEPDESVVLLGWNDKDIPDTHCFAWAETTFAMDVCDIPMVLIV